MVIQVVRLHDIPDGTLGKFRVLDKEIVVFSGYTLEPAGPDTIDRGKDRRIPEGYYNLDWHNSARFGRFLPLVYNEKVPKNRYILIHAGNYPKDTEGCFLVGMTMTKEGVFRSREALDKLIKILRQSPVNTLEILSDYRPIKGGLKYGDE